MYTAKYSSFIRLLFVGLMGLLFIEGTFADSSISIVRFDSPLPSPRATVYGIVAPPPAPTRDDPNSTPSQIRRFSLMPPSPLPTPTPIPDFVPPQTELQISGDAGVDGWYRSPVSVTFRITDNFFAGVTETQLDQATEWDYREYHYPPLSITDEGMHSLRYRSIDIVRNVEEPQLTHIGIDRTPPQTDDPSIDGNQLPNGWYNTPVTVTLQGQDALAGLAGFETAQTAGDWTASAATTVIANTTQQTLTWRAVDNAGNVSPAQELVLLIDLTPPTTTHSLAPLPPSGWYSMPVTVTLTAVDEGAGLFQTDYRLNNAATWQRYAAPFTISSDGLHTIDYQSSDRALNREVVNTFTLSLDRTPPTITTSVGGQPLAPGWYRADATLVATATDTLAGLATFDYRYNNDIWQSYEKPLTMPVGQQFLHLRARDQAGNTTISTLTLGVDTQPPTTTLQFTPQPNAAGWHNQPLTVTLVATDTESGLYQTQYQWQEASSPAIYQQPFQLAQEGITTLIWFSIDRTLNQEAPQTHTFAVDWTAPLITYTVTGDSVAPGWYRSAAQVTVTATDALARLDTLSYRLDNGAWQLYTNTLTMTTGGQHLIHLRAVDLADNIAEVTTIPIGIDTLPPQTTATLTGTSSPSGWYVTLVTVTLTSTDTGAGVATVEWRLNGGLWQAYTAPFVVSSERVNLLEYRATDLAGNQEEPGYTVFSIDRTDPTSRVGLLQGERGTNGWYTSPVTLTLSAQDLESGLQVLEYKVDEQPWQPYSATVTLADEGIHTIRYRAGDAGGRIETTQTLTVAVDLTAPLITTTFPATTTYANLLPSAYYTVTDSVSGIFTTTLLLNDTNYQAGQTEHPWHLGSNRAEINAVNHAGLISRRVLMVMVVGQRTYLPLIQAE